MQQHARHSEQEFENCAELLEKQYSTCMMVLVASMGMSRIRKDAAAAEATTVFNPTFNPAVNS